MQLWLQFASELKAVKYQPLVLRVRDKPAKVTKHMFVFSALANPIETQKRPRIPPLLKRGDIVMNGDKFRPEEDLFKSYVLTLTNQLYIVPSARSISKLAPLNRVYCI